MDMAWTIGNLMISFDRACRVIFGTHSDDNSCFSYIFMYSSRFLSDVSTFSLQNDKHDELYKLLPFLRSSMSCECHLAELRVTLILFSKNVSECRFVCSASSPIFFLFNFYSAARRLSDIA
jgi:hypothetical protein